MSELFGWEPWDMHRRTLNSYVAANYYLQDRNRGG
jgi:hypothetical protein